MDESFLPVFLVSFAIPLSIALIVLFSRKELHDLWTPAVDVFAVLLTSEGILLYDQYNHHILGRAFGMEPIVGFTLLLTITAPLLILALFVERAVIRIYVIRRWLRTTRVSRTSFYWTYGLWAAAVGIFGTQILFLLSASRGSTIPVAAGRTGGNNIPVVAFLLVSTALSFPVFFAVDKYIRGRYFSARTFPEWWRVGMTAALLREDQPESEHIKNCPTCGQALPGKKAQAVGAAAGN